MARHHVIGVSVLALLGLGAAVQWGNSVAILLEDSASSVSHGTASAGSLDWGKRLPTSGPNFRAYSRIGALLGRNAVHGVIRDVILDAYAALQQVTPDHRFVYGETGWSRGGSFRPHLTHQNGLSVDFMVPVRGPVGEVRRFPGALWNGLGYALDFDERGYLGELHIDFRTVAMHLEALERAAKRHGTAIVRVIFAPEYISALSAIDVGRDLPLRSWAGTAQLRHDDHYHVEFANPGLESKGAETDRRALLAGTGPSKNERFLNAMRELVSRGRPVEDLGAARADEPVVLIGDLNARPFSHHIRASLAA